MIRATKGKMFVLLAALVLSLTFAGSASAEAPKTIKQNGMELVHLRQAAEMYGYRVAWNGKEKSITLVYAGTMTTDDMMTDNDMMTNDGMMMDNDMMMNDDMMMDDGMMTNDDMMMEDDMMTDDGKRMEDKMQHAGQTIKIWIGSKKMTVDGKQMNLDTAPVLYRNSTYVVEAFVTKYMKPAQ